HLPVLLDHMPPDAGSLVLSLRPTDGLLRAEHGDLLHDGRGGPRLRATAPARAAAAVDPDVPAADPADGDRRLHSALRLAREHLAPPRAHRIALRDGDDLVHLPA